MKKNILLKFSLAVAGAMLFGAPMVSASSITSTTTPSYTNTPGTVGAYTVTNFATTATAMGGLIVQVNYVGGANNTCTWTNGVNGCSVSNVFSVSLANGANGSYDGTWTFADNRSAGALISSIVFLGSGAGNLTGTTVFDMCLNTPSNTVDHFDAGNCNGVGTTNSNIGWSAGTANGGSSGLSPNSIAYTNAVGAVGDEYSQVTFGFCTVSNGSAPCNASADLFSFGKTITWRMDTDTLGATATPEPATLGLVGFALLGLGVLQRRRNNRA